MAAASLARRRGERLGEPSFALRAAAPFGAAVFVAASALGLASAWTMSVVGRGTPLPLATAQRLVASGPYRSVRNPMAVAGIAQGIAVGLLRDSPLVVAYAIAGGVAWHCAVRPLEERELLARFGMPFTAYRERVPLWLPRIASRPVRNMTAVALLTIGVALPLISARVDTAMARAVLALPLLLAAASLLRQRPQHSRAA